MLPTRRENAGGGTGGGPESTDHNQSLDGELSIAANQIKMVARPPFPPAIPEQSVISILAAGFGIDGLVDIRGSQGVRVTAGPPPLLPASSATTNGVEIVAGEIGTVTIQRGLLPVEDQKIEMTPEGSTIDAGVGTVTIKSLTQIELSVCEGLAKLTLGPEGVTIQALQINLSAQVQAQIQGIITQLTGTAMTQISGGITMIG